MKSRRILAAALLLLIFGGLLAWALSQREPEYQGKTLRYWAANYGSNHWTAPNNPMDKQAETAIRSIGTNAIRACLKMMATKESPLRIKVTSAVPNKWLGFFQIRAPGQYRNDIYEYQSVGAYGLIALGDNAQPAIPALIALLADKHPGVRYHAVFALRCLGSIASNALPALIKCLEDTEFTVRDDAVISLGTIQHEPDKVVPVLIEFIRKYRDNKSHGPILCRNAIDALRAHGEKAKAAVPILLELLGDENEWFRSAATNALFQIDPEAVAKAGIK